MKSKSKENPTTWQHLHWQPQQQLLSHRHYLTMRQSLLNRVPARVPQPSLWELALLKSPKSFRTARSSSNGMRWVIVFVSALAASLFTKFYLSTGSKGFEAFFSLKRSFFFDFHLFFFYKKRRKNEHQLLILSKQASAACISAQKFHYVLPYSKGCINVTRV